MKHLVLNASTSTNTDTNTHTTNANTIRIQFSQDALNCLVGGGGPPSIEKGCKIVPVVT